MTRSHRIVSALALAAAVLTLGPASWSQEQKKNDGGRTVTEPKKGMEDPKASAPTTAAPVDPKSYKLGPEDVVFVRVWREPELTGPILVRPDGKISMPLIGELEAAGVTPEELGKTITDALGKVMNRPEVFISVQQVNSKKYYMVGEINRPGEYPLITRTTIFDAISKAGGLREYANGKKIVISRGDKRIKFNYKDVLAGKNLSQNIELENGDTIIVP
ncbi:MAG: polysaccharide biosynthesis/export family protein [Bryobacterales bacterium]|nr:polysaccharide biosynthesis/export family protein [Bryobacterales bacterium]